MRYEPLDTEFFKLNRRRFTREMKPNTLAIFNSNDPMPRSGDTFFPFVQNRDLFYLTGIEQEDTMLMLFPNCPKEEHAEVLLIVRPSEHNATWHGEQLTKEAATKISGIEKVLFLDEMSVVLNELILVADGVYVNTNENDRYNSPLNTRELRHTQELLRRYPVHTFHRAQPIMKKLAMVKTHFEVDLLRKSIEITGKAFHRTLNFVRPGVWEFEVEAEVTHEFLRNRANGHAYQPIIASGKNACVLHYIVNNQQCLDGDLVLMDFGCEYANYAADLTRTIPVNGVFTDRQRAVYNAVLRTLKEARAMLVPGTTLDEYNKEVGKYMTSELLALGLIKKEDVDKETKEKPEYKKYFMHGTSHHLGLDVHDLCNRYEPFRAGMVFTCEPGIYIPEEKIGIRLENDILITDDGPIDLFQNIPIEAEEIEALMHAELFQRAGLAFAN